MRRLLPILFAVLALAAPAQAVTIRDLIELTKAGLGEEVLLALVEVDGGVFPVDAETLRRLKDAGVPDRVIAAVVRSGRTPPPQAAVEQATEPAPGFDTYPAAVAERPAQAEPEVVYVAQPPVTVVQEVPVPYYVAVPVEGHARRGSPGRGSTIEPSITAPPHLQGPTGNRTDRPASPTTTYWGFGGTRRPDSWPASKPERKEPPRKGPSHGDSSGDKGSGDKGGGADR